MANDGVMELAIENIRGKNRKIVFPEGNDSRVLRAAIRHQNDGLIVPILLGDKEEIQKVADQELSLIHISEPTRREWLSRMPSSA